MKQVKAILMIAFSYVTGLFLCGLFAKVAWTVIKGGWDFIL